MAKIDRKKQARTTLDMLLKGIVQEGRIYAGALKRAWKSIQPYLNKARLEYFLRQNKVLIVPKAVAFIGKFDKKIPKLISPALVAAGFLPRYSLISGYFIRWKGAITREWHESPTSRRAFFLKKICIFSKKVYISETIFVKYQLPMSHNAAAPIYRIPLSSSNREYRDPRLLRIPEGKGEQCELLRYSILRRNQKLLYPEGKD